MQYTVTDYLYAAIPDSNKHLIKVGRSACPERRIKALKSKYKTNFELIIKIECANVAWLDESRAHRLLSEHWYDGLVNGISSGFEFFRSSPLTVKAAMLAAVNSKNSIAYDGLLTPRQIKNKRG